MKTKRTAHREMNQQKGSVWISGLIGGAIGLGIALLTLLVSPLALLKTSDPISGVTLIALLSVAAGGAVGGAMAASRFKESPLGAGMIAVGVMALPLLLITLFASGKTSVGLLGLIIASLLISALLGSYLVARSSRDRKKSMKKALKGRY